MLKTLSSYKGNEPYIFVSYAHRDSDRVLPVIRKLQEDSFRVWYDDGVDPGTEWDDNIAGYINRCTVFIAFLTENYIASKNCKDELSYSRELDKNQLLVYLEHLELPDGLKMRLNRLQAIHWYRYKNNTERAYQTLYSAPNLELCRDAAAEPEPETGPVPPAADVRNTETQATAEDQAAEDRTSDPVKPVRPGLRRTLLYICVGILAAAAVLAAVFWGLGRHRDDASNPETVSDAAVPAAEEAAAPADASEELPAEPADGEDGEAVPADASGHVILSADENMTVKEFYTAVDILKARLDILAGDADASCRMIAEGDTIDLWLPGELLAGSGIEYTMRCYLSRPTELYAFETFTEGMEQESTWVGTFARLPVAREELESVEIRHGTVDGADAEELAARGIEGDEYTYIELVLTDECAERLAEASAEWEDGLSFGQDMDKSTWYAYYTVPGGDAKTFYLVNADQEDRFSELLVYNLTHETPAYAFWFSRDLNETTAWERVETPDVLAGKYQCNAEDFTEQTVTFELSGYTSEYTAGEWYDLNAALKERLDALEIPYAFALRVEDYKTIMTVRCPMEHMGIAVIRLLGEWSWNVRSGLTERSVYGGEFTVRQTDGGDYEAVLQCEEYYIDEMQSVAAIAAEDGDGALYLAGEDVLCLRTTDLSSAEEGRFVFDRICLGGDEAITEDNVWLVNLIDAAWNGTPLPSTFTMDSIQYNPDAEGNIPTAEDFEIVDTESPKAVQAVREICPDAEAYTRNTSTLYVELHLAIDENLPEKSLALAEEIYRALDFENSSLQYITLYLVDEDNDTMERARIYFNKNYSSYDGDDGFVYANGIFCGGRLEEYKERMQEAVGDNAFFSEMNKADGEHSWYDWSWDLSF